MFSDYADEAFRYNSGKNLMWLEKCLIVRAKGTVSMMLIYPDDVPNAMAQLDFHFGLTEMLVKS